jgi:hypothetical protein
MRLLYLSHGIEETGGYLHEKMLAQTMAHTLASPFSEIRYRRNYTGFRQWLHLAYCAWRDAGRADIIITVARLAWPVWLRTRFRKTRIFLVLHNHDPNDGKPALYHRLLAAFLKKVALKHPGKVALVVVGHFWQHYFLKHFGVKGFIFPNLFADTPYEQIRQQAQKNLGLIHLGQWSDQADLIAYRTLIQALEPLGFQCYFSSPVPVAENGYPVRYFETHTDYLKTMATARVTVILNRVAEGWSRVAHESVLCGTVIIARPWGGIAELLKIARGFEAAEAEDVLSILTNKTLPLHAAHGYLSEFAAKDAPTLIKPLTEWLK